MSGHRVEGNIKGIEWQLLSLLRQGHDVSIMPEMMRESSLNRHESFAEFCVRHEDEMRVVLPSMGPRREYPGPLVARDK